MTALCECRECMTDAERTAAAARRLTARITVAPIPRLDELDVIR